MEQKEKELQPQTRAYTVEEIAAILHIGRSSAYTLVKKGYFKSVRIGTAIRISRKSFSFISDGHPPIPWLRKGTSKAYALAQPSASPESPLTSGWINWSCNTEERTMVRLWYAPFKNT